MPDPVLPADVEPPHPIRALVLIAELLGHTFGATCAYPVAHETGPDGCQRPADLAWRIERGWLRVVRVCSAGHESAWRDIYPLPIEALEPAVPDGAEIRPAEADDLSDLSSESYVVQWDGTALNGSIIDSRVQAFGGTTLVLTDGTFLIRPPGNDVDNLVLGKGGWLAVDQGLWGAGPTMSDAIAAVIPAVEENRLQEIGERFRENWPNAPRPATDRPARRDIGFEAPRSAQPADEPPAAGPYLKGPAELLDEVKYLALPNHRWTIYEMVIGPDASSMGDPAPDGFEPYAVTVDADGATHFWSKSVERI